MTEEDSTPPYRSIGSPHAEAEGLPLGGRPLSRMRLALVTGGHRRLGAAISLALARAGHALAIHGSHDVEMSGDLSDALRECGAVWDGFVTDFNDLDAAEELVAEVAVKFGRPPDILVNCAAMFGQDRLESVTPESLMQHYAINCAAPILLTKAFSTVPSGASDRCVINILDQRIAQPHGDQLAYTVSKQALAGFTQAAARSLAPRVRVNAVAPGLTIATDDYADGQMERLAAQMPLQCLPQPDQIADAVCYLAGASAVTGQVIYVDGGAHMCSYDRDFMHL